MASRVLQGVLGRVDSAAIEQAVSGVAAIDRRAFDQMARTIDLVARNRKTADLAAGPSGVALGKQMRLIPGPLASISKQLAEFSRAMEPGLGISKQLAEFSRAMEPGLGISKQLAEFSRAMEPGLGISKQMRQAIGPLSGTDKLLSAFGVQFAEFNRPLIRSSLFFAALPRLRFSPEWEQLWDDIDTAESFDPTVAALSEHEMETPIGVFAAELAVPALAGRVRRLGETWSAPALADAACQLEEEDARWRTADDERTFASIIHRTVSVLEEVARQIAYYQVTYGQDSYIREATLPDALKVLTKRGVITRPERERMTQAWSLRSKTPGAGHGVGGAPKEAAGFVLLRVRQGLRELLDAAEAGEWLRA